MSSVAGAVVTIDGDSSGLVGALQKGEKGIDDVKQSAGKLSDQLREVADDADAAAGALVQKLGGPGAIKAIAGVTAGFAIAKQGVDMFLDSAENLFKSYGEEGQKVWDETEKSLFAIKGAFAEAVLGGADMEEMGARLKVVFETALDVINFLLIPVRALSSLLWMLRGDTDDATAATDKLNEAMVRTAEAQATAAAAVAQRSVDIKALYNQALRDIGKEQVAEQDAQLAKSEAYQAGFQDLLGQSALKAAKILAEGSIYVQDNIDEYEAAMLELGDSPEATAKAMSMFAKAGLEKELGMVFALRQASIEALEKSAGKGQDTGAPRGVSSAMRTAADEVVYAVQLAEGGYEKITKAQYDALDTMQQQTGDYSQRIMEMSREDFANMERYADSVYLNDIELNEKRLEAQAEYEKKSQAGTDAFTAAFYAARQEMLDKEEEAEKTKAANILKAKQVVFDLTITQNAKMLAAAIVAEKSASDIARAAMGNVASGLGDLAMIKSGAYAAEGLFPQAAGMAVVGTTAYTIAGLLGADKKANAGPPTESKREQPVQNYAYNLRIDSAFADSESISRRFAQMQEGARARGLVPGMA
jgi:hypothetical protein